MFKPTAAFSGFSVDDLSKAKEFYVTTLGLELNDEKMGPSLILPGGADLFIYEKADHEPAGFTVLNFVVDNIDEAVEDLKGRGIEFERYDLGDDVEQDDDDILRGLAADMGPDIAWFEDPAGNVLAVLQNE